MSNPWARKERTPASGNAWAVKPRLHESTVRPNKWARTTPTTNGANPWARKSADTDSDDPDSAPSVIHIALQVVSRGDIQEQLSVLADDSKVLTVGDFGILCKNISTLVQRTGINDGVAIGNACLVINDMFNTLAKRNDAETHLDNHVDTTGVCEFITAQISTGPTKSAAVMSRTAEAQTHGISTYQEMTKRSIMSTCAVTVQRCCANAFLELLCTKVGENGGCCECFYEKHRGDETPFARCRAHDNVFDEGAPALPAEAEPTPDAPLPATELAKRDSTKGISTQVSIRTHTVAANLKVYSSDFEVGALFTFPTSQLLTTFKMICPLARMDRCTAKVYHGMHAKQSRVLPVRSRFRRFQRVHCSDGDKALNLAEKHLASTMRDDESNCWVPTLRSQCVVHRVYHCITHGMDFISNYITAQIRLALSLKGPGNFTKFKSVFWEWLQSNQNHSFIVQTPLRGPGAAADLHRTTTYSLYFPKTKGANQRKNRLKFFVVTRLANGDIRDIGVLQHYCSGPECCKDKQDFLRKLKWFVAICCGRLVICFPRGRWTRMDEVIDFIGCLASIHGIIGIVYGLWYQKLTGKPPPPTTQVKPTTNTTPILALMNVGIEDPYDVSDLLDDSVAPAAKSAAAKAQAKSAAKTDKELDAEHTKNASQTGMSHSVSRVRQRLQRTRQVFAYARRPCSH